MQFKSTSYFVLLAALMLGVSACAKKQVLVKTPPPPAQEQEDVDDTTVVSDELDIHGKEFSGDAKLQSIYFDFDDYEFYDASRKILDQNAKYMRNNPKLEFLVEGHCDQRGTSAYNLSLGQKRAAMVREYYISIGVPSTQIGTLSYGKEKPTCQEESESCWGKNRRGETKARQK